MQTLFIEQISFWSWSAPAIGPYIEAHWGAREQRSVEGFVMSSNNARWLGLVCELWGSLESSLYGRKRQVEDLNLRVLLREI